MNEPNTDAGGANQLPNPLDAANVVYDKLAARLGFKRQPGTREILTRIADLLLDPNSTPREAIDAMRPFDDSKQVALAYAITVYGRQEMGLLLKEQLANPHTTRIGNSYAVFDLLERD